MERIMLLLLLSIYTGGNTNIGTFRKTMLSSLDYPNDGQIKLHEMIKNSLSHSRHFVNGKQIPPDFGRNRVVPCGINKRTRDSREENIR